MKPLTWVVIHFNRLTVDRYAEYLSAGQRIAPKVHIGTHSMRKTRGYAMYDSGRSIESICKVLNHSTPAVTMRYIGIDQRDIDQSYVEFELWKRALHSVAPTFTFVTLVGQKDRSVP